VHHAGPDANAAHHTLQRPEIDDVAHMERPLEE
jgi:hypothetical protein